MSALPCGPVAWSDGMLIEVQHFQQQERYLSHQQDLRLAQLSPHGWGFSVLELDDDGLGMGRFGLRQARGIFQDGTPFALPTHDTLPAPLDTAGAQAGDVAYLAIQAARTGGPEMAFGLAEQASRYRAVDTEVPDVSVGLDAPGTPRRLTLQTGRLQARLCWQSQLRSDEAALPVARVLRRSSSQVVSLDSRFIPPLLNARAHPSLLSLLEELQSVLQVRLSGSSGVRALSAAGGVADLVELLLRQALSEYRLRLGHLQAFDPLHPAQLFHELIGFLGRLSVLPGVEEEIAESQLPYLHQDLQATFEPLSQHLRRAVARVIESPVVPLRFEPRGDQIHLCVVDKQWQLQKLIFAVSAALPAEQMRRLLPQQAKLGPVEHIQKLIDLQLPGARLQPLAHPPRQVPYYAQSVYFEVESSDPYWSQTFAGAAMALRIVGDFPELRFEAWGLREGKVA